MSQIEAVAKVLKSCARLLRRMAMDGHADISDALTTASVEADQAAIRITEAINGRAAASD